MTTNRFSIPLATLAEKAKLDVATVARKATVDLFSAVVQRSPVGNPELWAANADVSAARKSYADAAVTYNADNPGARRKGTSRRSLDKKFPLVTGKGYVGGRFKANWNYSENTLDETITDSTTKERGLDQARRATTMAIGGVTYLSNGLPYAYRLEFEGWSKQAPVGMVRVSAVEFADHVRTAVPK